MTDDPSLSLTDPERRERAAVWFATLRDRICAEFEAIEDEFAAGSEAGSAGRFVRSDWQRPDGDQAAAAARWR